jgi:hypothetical protein
MLAKSLIAKLKILEIYDTYSIKIIKGINTKGTPSGRNKTNNFS